MSDATPTNFSDSHNMDVDNTSDSSRHSNDSNDVTKLASKFNESPLSLSISIPTCESLSPVLDQIHASKLSVDIQREALLAIDYMTVLLLDDPSYYKILLDSVKKHMSDCQSTLSIGIISSVLLNKSPQLKLMFKQFFGICTICNDLILDDNNRGNFFPHFSSISANPSLHFFLLSSHFRVVCH